MIVKIPVYVRVNLDQTAETLVLAVEMAALHGIDLRQDGETYMQAAQRIRDGARPAADPGRLVVVHLNGGMVGFAVVALAVNSTDGHTANEWSALVRFDLLNVLLNHTGARQVGEVEPWDGEPFGEASTGTVSRWGGRIVGSPGGRYTPEWIADHIVSP